jgi:hypothetical protein
VRASPNVGAATLGLGESPVSVAEKVYLFCVDNDRLLSLIPHLFLHLVHE